MSMEVDGNFITYNDGTKQQSANWRVLNTSSTNNDTAYTIGTYLLCDIRTYNGKTNPMPLDGWGRYYSGPSLMTTPAAPNNSTTSSAVYSPTSTSSFGAAGYLQPCIMDGAYGGSILAGTWVSRGSCLTQAFVVRVA